MLRTWLGFWRATRHVDFPVCSALLIACIGPKKIVLHLGMDTHKNDAIIILEAVVDQETWIWHAFFGMPRSCNDINVLQRSPLFAMLANGESPPVEFESNGRTYHYGYYLADGIYPKWATFVKPITNCQGRKELQFHNAQTLARKDVERTFRILQAQFSIVR